MATVSKKHSEVWTKADAIYRETIRPQLTQSDKGKYLYIHTGTGEWLIDNDERAILQKALERWGGGQPLFFMQIGYRAPTSFRAGLNLELADW